MLRQELVSRGLPAALLVLFALPAGAQSFRVQCPTNTALHPLVNASGQASTDAGAVGPFDQPNPHIKCQQLSGGDGFATMGDGTQTYLFAFGPLSGLSNIVKGLPGTVTASEFNQSNVGPSGVLDVIKIGAPDGQGYSFNGAIGLVPDPDAGGALTGHVDPRLIMDVGVLNGNIPAPLIAIDEADELFLTLTNVGQIMRPDLFEQHTVHFHGYPNASAFYDGVPDASVAINVGGSFTYYYLAPEAGTYMWHCHISPPEHLQELTSARRCRSRTWLQPPAAAACTAMRSCAPARRRCRRMARPRMPAASCTPTTTATARRPMTSSIRSTFTVSTRTSTSWA